MVRTVTAILMLSCATHVVAQSSDAAPSQILLFGGVSENANNLPLRTTLLITDQKVSPFFSLGGWRGFEFSVTRQKRRHLAFTADLSAYAERYTGGATYCQHDGCGTGLRYANDAKAFYLAAGPELRGSERWRMTPFAHALGGAVFTRSKFAMAGSNVQYVNPFSGTGLILLSATPFPKTATLSYTDSHSDIGLTASLGVGFDVRISSALSSRILFDYDPTFLTRPDFRNEAIPEPTGSTHMQAHIRMTFGVVWRPR